MTHRRAVLVLLAPLVVAGCASATTDLESTPGTGSGVTPGPGEVRAGGSVAATSGAAAPTASGGARASEGPTHAPDGQRGRVTHVVDGDTIDVAGVGRVRVIGIDTPERGACGYESATLAMSALVLGRQVVLRPGAADDVDRYGRLLRFVDVAEGGRAVDAGLALIEDGWAVARYDSRDGYGRHPREDAYVAADAASADLGCYPDDEP